MAFLKTRWKVRLTIQLSTVVELIRLQACRMKCSSPLRWSISHKVRPLGRSFVQPAASSLVVRRPAVCGASLHMVGQVKVTTSHVRGSTWAVEESTKTASLPRSRSSSVALLTVPASPAPRMELIHNPPTRVWWRPL